ncbi:MAG: response regulator [Deltaproteobacteria bacterium]|nr:response regulator [Deltaproteobacteria bacterium]
MASLRRVLVVDDSPTIRRVVSQVLRQAGYDVATADDAEAGIAEARAVKPDLILLDFVMPGMNGYQFVKRLDAEDASDAPIVLMTTRSDQVPEGALRALGVVDAITKPFSPDAILAVVAHCLEKHGGQQRAETTRVTSLAHADHVPEPGAEEPAGSTGRADDVLKSISRLLVDALAARDVKDADGVANSICADLRAGLPALPLQEALHLPRPSLAGDLAAVPLPEVLQLLKFQGQTGVLLVALTDEPNPPRFEIAVRHGMIIGVRARDVRSDLLLGNYFLAGGMVSRAQLDAMLAKPAGTPIGQRLVEAGLITTEQLRRCVGAQAQDLMTELLRARRGFFGLRRGDDMIEAPVVSPGFSVDGLLFEALRRIDEWAVIETAVPSLDARFSLVSSDVADLAPDELEVLSVFAGGAGAGDAVKDGAPLSVRDVLRLLHLRAFDACRVLYRLCMVRRLVRVDDGAAGNIVGDLGDLDGPGNDRVVP